MFVLKSFSGRCTLNILAVALYARAAADSFDPNTSPTGEGCVDPKGFTDCFATSANNLVSCGEFCKTQNTLNYNDCILGCGKTQLSRNLGCWIQSCWNQVYSCEYQLTAIQYLKMNNLVQGHPDNAIPFYPAPDGASGSCSCNLGHVYGNSSFISFNNACLDPATSGDSEVLNNCHCCEFSVKVSNIITSCPKSDLTNLADISSLISNTQNLISDSATQCSVLETNPGLCINEYKFPYANETVLNPLNLPSLGTEPVTNLPGNAFTEPGEESFTLSLKGFSSVISLAPFTTTAGAVTGTINGNAIATATGSATTKVEAGKKPSATSGGTAQTLVPGSAATRKVSKIFSFGGIYVLLSVWILL